MLSKGANLPLLSYSFSCLDPVYKVNFTPINFSVTVILRYVLLQIFSPPNIVLALCFEIIVTMYNYKSRRPFFLDVSGINIRDF
jgi:hypothetical protein